jgi:hypothetical protein
VSPVGQLHDPPGPEQVSPLGQFAEVQQVPAAMHALLQMVPPFAHSQLPPGPVHV